MVERPSVKPAEPLSSMQVSLKAVIGICVAIVGCFSTGIGTYWMMKDRMLEEVRDQVKMEKRISDVENQAEKNREDIYILKTSK